VLGSTVILCGIGRMFSPVLHKWNSKIYCSAVFFFFFQGCNLSCLSLLLLLCVIRKKRRMEGTYRPSAEERKQTGAAGSEKPGLPLPLPKEERLI
uniref:Crumbs homolog 3b n=1 Tax=Seriola dumerili TaxID=41447 RepID=A0A3B4TGT1_SERDU